MNEALQRPEVSIFLVTAISYLIGFLIYGGYLSAFAGSTGNTPFALADLTLIDLIAILPMAVITVLTKALQAIPRVLLYIFIYGIIPTLVSVAVYIFVGPKIYPPWSDTTRLLALALWIGVEFFSTWKNIRYKSWQFVLVTALLLIAAFLFGISLPPFTDAQSTSTGSGLQIINYLLGVVIVVFALFTAYVVGILTAEAAVEWDALSKVTRLVLQQPLPTIGATHPVTIDLAIETKPAQRSWFRPAVSPTKTTELFICVPSEDAPIYLISAFRNITLFYIPRDPSKKIMDGRVVTVLNGLIYSIEVSVRRRNVK